MQKSEPNIQVKKKEMVRQPEVHFFSNTFEHEPSISAPKHANSTPIIQSLALYTRLDMQLKCKDSMISHGKENRTENAISFVLGCGIFAAMSLCRLNTETLHKTHHSSTKRTHIFQTSNLTVRKQKQCSEESIDVHSRCRIKNIRGNNSIFGP